MDRIVIVGASLAGLRAAETLRQHGYDGAVTVVGAEEHRPYDRPPLSKKLLAGEWEPDRIHLRRPDVFDELDVEWRLGTTAIALDLEARDVELGDGRLGFDGLVIACGAIPRRLPDQERHAHVHELRTLDDSLALRSQISSGDRRVVVIGAGFIGLEVAATARAAGNEVTVLEGAPAPLIRGLGAEVGTRVGALLARTGVEIRCDVGVAGFDAHGVVLADDEHVAGDVVLVGVGVTPATGWLEASGLEVRDGVVCDATLNALDATGEPVAGVYAAGDVARWPNDLFGEEMRVEHWTNAAEQGAHAAQNLLAVSGGDPAQPYAPVPFVWSDQGDVRIQFLGRGTADDEVEIIAERTAGDGPAKLLALYHRAGRLRGAAAINAPKWLMPLRKQLLDGASIDDARSFAMSMVSS